MARLEDLTPAMAQRLRELECPVYASAPFVTGGKLSNRRVAIVSSAGIHRRGEPPMMPGANEFRELPASLASGDIAMTHVSVNYDRTGFQRDINTVYPIDRLAAGGGWRDRFGRRHPLLADGRQRSQAMGRTG